MGFMAAERAHIVPHGVPHTRWILVAPLSQENGDIVIF